MRVPCNAYLPLTLKLRVQKYATSLGISQSALVQRALIDFLSGAQEDSDSDSPDLQEFRREIRNMPQTSLRDIQDALEAQNAPVGSYVREQTLAVMDEVLRRARATQ